MATGTEDKKGKEGAKAEDVQVDAKSLAQFADGFISPSKAKEKGEDGKPKEEGGEGAKKKEGNPVATPAAPVIDEKKLGAAIGEGVAAAMKQRDDEQAGAKKKEGEQKPDENAHLSESNKKKFAVLKKMGDDAPEKYKGLADKFSASVKALAQYAEDWKKNHPGEDFNEEDTQHADFFAKNDVDWEDDDYIEAKAQLIADKAIEKSTGGIRGELDEVKQKERLRDAAPQIESERVATAKEFFTLAGDEFADILKDDGTVDFAKVKEIQESSPVVGPIMLAAAAEVELLAATTFKLYEGLEKFNPKDTRHVQVDNFITNSETALSAKPKEQRLDDKGRDFLPSAEYYKRVQADPKTKDAFWTYQPRDINVLLAARIAKTAKKISEQEQEKAKKVAKSLGYVEGQKKESKEEGGGGEVEEKPKPDDVKPKSPSITEKPIVASRKKGEADDSKSGVNTFVKGLLGK